MRNGKHAAAWTLLLAWTMGWPAQAQVTIPDEYGKHIQQRSQIAAGGAQFGERVDPNTGDLEIVQTDVELPGNGPAVRVGRRYRPRDAYGKGHFNYWDMDIPHLHGTFADIVSPLTGWTGSGADPKQRCSHFSEPRIVSSQGGWFTPDEYWSGSFFYLPGGGEQELLERGGAHVPSDGAAYPVVTKEGAAVRCVSLAATSEGGSGEGEGFEIVTPDGMVYTLNQMVSRYEKPLRKASPITPFNAGGDKTDIASAGPGSAEAPPAEPESVGLYYVLGRKEVLLFPTQVKDRFGNTATYVWSTTNPWQLLWIEASDGRRLDFTYESPTSNRVTAVSDGSRTWQYTYFPGFGQTDDPDTVILPDGSQWISRLRRLSLATTPTYNVTCDNLNISASADTGSITNPSGATLLLTMASVKFGRSWVPRECIQNGDGSEHAVEPNLFVGYAVTSKKITGPGLPAAGLTWTYSYGTPNNCWNPAGATGSPVCTAASPTTRTTMLTDPDGTVTRYSFGNRFKENEGLSLKTEYGWNGSSALRTETVAYADPETGPYAAFNGNSRRNVGDYDITGLKRPRQQVATFQQGTTFTWQANSFDAYAHPLSATRSSTLGYSRTDVTAYHHNTAKWVIGQPASSTNSNTGLVESQTLYDPTYALPIQTKSFGKLQQTLAYDTASAVATGQRGTLLTVKDGNNNVTTFTQWKRGIPQKIAFADAKYKSALVDDLGQLTWVEDENRYRTCYSYDAMGRLAGITYPSEAAVSTCNTSTWANTTIAFAKNGAAIYGLPAGHWKQTVATGNARKDIYFDALWRPVVTSEYDNADIPNTLRQTATRYDAEGRATFASYPQRTLDAAIYNTWANPAVAPNATGTDTTYDALGRVLTTKADSELPGQLTTTYEYLSSFQTKVTNPRGLATTYRYYTYDQPNTDQLRMVIHPEGAITEFYRDAFGKPLNLIRHNSDSSVSVNRTYTYTSNTQELCRTVEPETGATDYGYDGAGNLKWSAAGLPSNIGCDLEGDHSAIAPRRVDRTYDTRNRLKTLHFPDGLGDQTWTYTPDGLAESIITDNGGGQVVTNSYTYNRRRLPVGERLQWGGIDWNLGWGYSGNGHVSGRSQPGAATIAFAPNALGQPTQVGSFATNVSYYPNGAVKQFTYGNGLTHTLTQNVRGLPDTRCDFYTSCPATTILNDGYDYDQNGNVAAISDGIGTHRGNRTMSYDGLDRLKTAVSPMYGNAAYAYDALDNLTRATIGGTAARDHWYCYDAHNQLTNVKTGGCAGASVIGLGYDVQGNLANKNGVAYSFDFGNRLRSVASAPASSYVYDGQGRRTRDYVGGSKYSFYSREGQLVYANDLRQTPAQSDVYYYLGSRLVAVQEIANGVGTVKYQHTDALGSPVAVTDANRVVIEKNEYEPFGLVNNHPPKDGPGYTGHVLDAATGLNYMQQRYCDPMIGRCLSVDPVTAYSSGDMRFFNRYAYGFNNPYKFRDPDGRAPCGEILPCAPKQDPKLALADQAVANNAKTLVTGLAVTSTAGATAAVAVGTGAVATTAAVVGRTATAANSAYTTAGIAVYAKGVEAAQFLTGKIGEVGQAASVVANQIGASAVATASQIRVGVMTSPVTVAAMNQADKIADFIDGAFNPGPPPMTPAGVVGGVVSSPESIIEVREPELNEW